MANSTINIWLYEKPHSSIMMIIILSHTPLQLLIINNARPSLTIHPGEREWYSAYLVRQELLDFEIIVLNTGNILLQHDWIIKYELSIIFSTPVGVETTPIQKCRKVCTFSFSVICLFFSMPGKPKGGHKGRMRRFVTEEEIADQEEKKKREQEWKASEWDS